VLRFRRALVLEAIELRHQIAVLERGRTRRPCFCRSDRLLWMLLSRWWSFCEQCGARLEALCPFSQTAGILYEFDLTAGPRLNQNKKLERGG
jgi:hypothetical protein